MSNDGNVSDFIDIGNIAGQIFQASQFPTMPSVQPYQADIRAAIELELRQLYARIEDEHNPNASLVERMQAAIDHYGQINASTCNLLGFIYMGGDGKPPAFVPRHILFAVLASTAIEADYEEKKNSAIFDEQTYTTGKWLELFILTHARIRSSHTDSAVEVYNTIFNGAFEDVQSGKIGQDEFDQWLDGRDAFLAIHASSMMHHMQTTPIFQAINGFRKYIAFLDPLKHRPEEEQSRIEAFYLKTKEDVREAINKAEKAFGLGAAANLDTAPV